MVPSPLETGQAFPEIWPKVPPYKETPRSLWEKLERGSLWLFFFQRCFSCFRGRFLCPDKWMSASRWKAFLRIAAKNFRMHGAGNLLEYLLSILFGQCYGLNCVPLKSICWRSNPQNLRLWLRFETRPLERWWCSWALWGWDWVWSDLCPCEKREFGHKKRHRWCVCTGERVEAQGEGGRLHAEETRPRRNQPCQHLVFEHRNVSTFLLFKPLPLWGFVMVALAN